MDGRRGLVSMASAILMVAACGNTSTGTRPSGSPSASTNPSAATSPFAFPSPTPGGPSVPGPATVNCSSQIPAGHQLALVTLRGVAGIVVRDVTDVGHPVSRCSISQGSYMRLVSGTQVSYIVTSSPDQGASGALYLVDLQTQSTSLVRAWTNGGYFSWVYGWSPDGRWLTYLSSDSVGVQWHLLSAAGDRMLSNLGAVVPRNSNPDFDDGMVGFSADGLYVAGEETLTYQSKATVVGLAPPIQVVRVADRKLMYSTTEGTMAAWSGSGAHFYFRTAAGVRLWDPSGKVRTVVAGLSWIHPRASADGSHMAYSTLDAQGNHRADVLDLSATTSPKGATVGVDTHELSSQPRVGAAFLTSALVWYAGEEICTTVTPCGLGGPPLTGVTYISDLVGVENQSIDTAFFDSWPHVVGQS